MEYSDQTVIVIIVCRLSLARFSFVPTFTFTLRPHLVQGDDKFSFHLLTTVSTHKLNYNHTDGNTSCLMLLVHS